MLECIEKISIIQDQGNIADDFILYDAILRNLQILSESTSHFPESIKLQYPDINWKDIMGFRNILVHNYLGNIDPETVQKVVSDYLPELDKAIKLILGEQNKK